MKLMRLIKTKIHKTHDELFRELKYNLNHDVISDTNDSRNIYQGYSNFLHGFGVFKHKTKHDTLTSRYRGNVPPHKDDIDEFKSMVYLLVLDVSPPNKYVDSQELPLLYQSGEFLSLRKGDLIKFNQCKEHMLIWDKRIDIATFWIPQKGSY